MITFEDRDEIEPRLRLSRADHEMVIALSGQGMVTDEIVDYVDLQTPRYLRGGKVAAILFAEPTGIGYDV